jgi:NACalpha-BTF3-like transcription factor
MIDLSKEGFMSDAAMREKAPSIFNTQPSDSVSKHYTHIPTTKVIRDMKTLGWEVIDVTEVKARKEATVGVQKHLVVFRNPDVVINGEDGDIVYPQILLTNSHDGKNAFKFQAGLFRTVCENGLVIATESFQDVKMRHMGYTFEELQINIREMVERLPLTVESMNKMKEIELDQQSAVDFAKRALETRFTQQEIDKIEIDFEQLLTPIRKEDEGKDVWSVFNVVQEKMIEGDFQYRSGTKVRKARKVKNFSQDLKINKELFQLALEFAN